MQQLSGMDTSFLAWESATMPAHVASLVVYDPATASEPFTFERQRRLFLERLPLVAPFTRRLVEVPLGLDKPYWIEDPDFDIDYHMRHIAVPSPGGREEISQLAAEIMARPLDRRRPLWQTYVIEGLEGGYVAQLTKVHHAACDGVSGAEILGVLLDIGPEVGDPPESKERQVERVPGSWEMLLRGSIGMMRTPRAGWRFVRRAVPVLPRVAETFLPALRTRSEPYLSRPATMPPKTPFNQTVSAHRRWAFNSLPLEDVKTVKKLLDVTVNDVVMTMCAGALRRWLIEHEALPIEPLVAMVPISVRTDEQRGTFGNRVSVMMAELPTDEADPVLRLERMRDEMRIAKESHAAMPADLLQDLTQFTPPSVLSAAARVMTRARLADRMGPPFNVTISNVPGPQFPLYCGGALMKGIWPLSPIVDGVGLNMTLMSYNGSLDFGILADRELIRDVERIGDFLGDELTELLKAAQSA